MDRPLRVSKLLPLVLVALVLASSSAHAAWAPTGNPVCVAPGAQYEPLCRLPWILWTDERSGTPQLYVTLLDWRTGEPFRSPANGSSIAASSTSQQKPDAQISTYDGSLVVAWSEDRGTGSGPDIYMMRVRLENGAPDPGWPAGGLRVCGASGEQRSPRVLHHDELTPSFDVISHYRVTWEDARDGTTRIYGANVTRAGVLDAGWPADGVLVSTGSSDHRNVALVTEGDEFASIWETEGHVAAQAVSGAGVVPAGGSWPAAGRALSDPAFTASGATAVQEYGYSPYGSYRTLVSWLEQRGDLVQVRAQGWWDGTTQMLAPEAIAAVDDENASPLEIHLYPLGHGDHQSDRVRLFWRDGRSDAGDLHFTDLVATRQYPPPYPYLLLYATPPGGGEPFVLEPGEQRDVTGLRGVFWQDTRSGIPQVHTAVHGRVAPTSAAQTQPSATWAIIEGWIPESPPPPDVVVWTDERHSATAPDIYAQVLGPGGPGQVDVESEPRVPARVECSAPRPSPTNGAVSFQLRLPVDAAVELDVIDVSGRVVRPLFRRRLPAGEHPFTWDGRYADGRPAAPGLYWIGGLANGVSFSRRIVMLGR